MPDKRRHRGPHPEDSRLFEAQELPRLHQAVGDFCFLLTRGYAEESALKLVGDRYQLRARQRLAVLRSSCSDAAISERSRKRQALEALAGQPLLIDAYNVLITIESALGGGVILGCRDGCCRDLASVHGSYRHVDETVAALLLVGQVLADSDVESATWYLDSPVSNSGRLAQTLRQVAAERGWTWTAELVQNPDPILAEAAELVATSDSWILDGCRAWVNLTREIIDQKTPEARVIELGA